MKQKIAVAFIMGFISTGLISFIIISTNAGFSENFLSKWCRSWMTAFSIIVPTILFFGPKVKRFVDYLFRKK
ncbi:DUF2798 domain-containing protein [Flavobacterium sp. 3-210]